jgi:site-specific recombinase XerD
MRTTQQNQGIILKYSQETHILTWAEAFLIDRKAQRLSEGTQQFYRKQLKRFTDYCETQLISDITEITPDTIRLYLLYLEEKGHNPGGIHASYRTLRAFLYWWEQEIEPDNWKNPIKKVKAPRVPVEPIEPVEVDCVKAMIDTCKKGTFQGNRNRAILLALMDTGARANEFLDINLHDLNPITGEILIRQGKGHKPRTVYLGKKSRKALRAYLRKRSDDSKALWVSRYGERLSYGGLRSVIRVLSERAGVKRPSLHDFRRYFALSMLRAGVDIFSLQKLMGHADLQVLRRYLAQTTNDTIAAHRKGGPVDNAGL